MKSVAAEGCSDCSGPGDVMEGAICEAQERISFVRAALRATLEDLREDGADAVRAQEVLVVAIDMLGLIDRGLSESVKKAYRLARG